MNAYDVNAFSDDEDVLHFRAARTIRQRPNHFEKYNEKEFFRRFRLSTRTVENIIEEIGDDICHKTNKNYALSPSEQVLLTLRYYATGSFLSVAADFCEVSVSTASTTIARVSNVLAGLRPYYIRMPSSADEITDKKDKFYSIARFPNCIVAIDCSHVKIQSPGGERAEVFRNRKQYFSLNVQTVADPSLKICDIVSRWPGSAHDAHIFRNSRLMRRFEEGNFENSVIVGDAGYPIKNYLITPLAQCRTNAENLFNESQIRTRNVVERSYGVWKRRFPGLALGLRVKLETVQAIIVATAVLHNIACEEKEEEPPVEREEEEAVQWVNNNPANPEDARRANVGNVNNMTRYQLITNYFARL